MTAAQLIRKLGEMDVYPSSVMSVIHRHIDVELGYINDVGDNIWVIFFRRGGIKCEVENLKGETILTTPNDINTIIGYITKTIT